MKHTLKLSISAVALSFLAMAHSGNAQPSSMNSDFKLTSSSVKENQLLDQKFFWNNFGCTGGNVSPQLTWTKGPVETKSYAITFYDKDAPTGSGFWHYQAYNIPANTTSIPEGALSEKKIPEGTVESNTDLGAPGYFGPCPPVGREHTYVYTVYALSTPVLNGADGKPANGKQTSALTGFFLWASKPLAKASLSVKAKR
jgi:hypothetical protein